MAGPQGSLERQVAVGFEADAPVTGAEITPVLDLPYTFAKAHGLVLRYESNARLIVAMREGADPLMLLEVRRYLAMPFDVEIADNQTFDRYLSDHYAMDGSAAAMAGSIGSNDGDLLSDMLPSADDLLDSADDAPVIRLINGIIAEAVRQVVSDIHIEPYETGLVIRMRADGVLQERLRLRANVAPVVVSRIKVMARLDLPLIHISQPTRLRRIT